MGLKNSAKKLFLASVAFLVLQILFYLYLAFMENRSINHFSVKLSKMETLGRFLSEVKTTDYVLRDLGCSPFIVNPEALSLSHLSSLEYETEMFTLVEGVVLGVDFGCMSKIKSPLKVLHKSLRKDGFTFSYTESRKTIGLPLKTHILPTAFIVRRMFAFVIVVLHSREDNYWWHGSISKNANASKILSEAQLLPNNLNFIHNEGAIPKIELKEDKLYHHHFLVPKNITAFLKATSKSTSKFIECDYKGADLFFRSHGRDQSIKAVRFKHQAWKLLSRAKKILSQLEIPFWLSSGTCLGYLRQCEFIPYSQDVDLGVFATDYNKEIIPAFLSHGFKLHHTFGKPNDSYQIAFEYNQIKLDIFFFYFDKENQIMWNGGTEARSGRKFKYSFTAFSLCWTEFLELLVRVPCDTESYIEANYGPKWFMPVTKWSWKSSPPNVQSNGVWPKEEWSQVINLVSS